MGKWEKCKDISTTLKSVRTGRWIRIRQAVENKDQLNKVMVSLSNKVTAQLC